MINTLKVHGIPADLGDSMMVIRVTYSFLRGSQDTSIFLSRRDLQVLCDLSVCSGKVQLVVTCLQLLLF